MFGLASGVYQNYFAPPKLSILIIGLDGSGKTALLERIKVTNITTQVDVSSHLPPSYSKGAVVLGSSEWVTVASEEDGAAFNGRKVGGTPARLPPPLPPSKAARGRKFVEKAAAASSSSSAQNRTGENSRDYDEDEHKINEAARLFISSDVPPLPFDMSSNTQQSSRPPLPTSNTKRKDVVMTSSNPNNDNARGGSVIMNMLRCPSPQKYTAAAVGGEEDEYLDEHDVANSTTSASSQSGLEDDEIVDEGYLQDYHIDFNESQQFDVKNSKVKIFPLDKIRPTLGQNLAKLDMCGCKCSLFDLSGAEKMRPLWERYYRDADAIVYVVNCADTSLDNLEKSRSEFEQLCQNDVIQRHCRAGLPILIFANQIDLAYREYGDATGVGNVNGSGAMNGGGKREVSWNADEEDNFVGGGNKVSAPLEENGTRALEFDDLAAFFGLHNNESNTNMFLFGGSAKSGEGVRASMEVLTAHAKRYRLGRQ
jgi:GTPase SAR1 family protein